MSLTVPEWQIDVLGMFTGIMNHDEYSLVREIEQEEIENKPNFGTLTLKKKKEGDKERDAKMEQLKKKLRTDDERELHAFLVWGFVLSVWLSYILSVALSIFLAVLL